MVKRVLVIVSGKATAEPANWYNIFSGCTLASGEPVEVDQAEYVDISCAAYHDGKVICRLNASRQPIPGTIQGTVRTFVPDFVLFRSITVGIHLVDATSTLYAFKHAGIPSVNSIDSIILSIARPVMYGELRRVMNEQGGPKEFPLIPQNYYAKYSNMLITPDLPFVVKVGGAHAGYGKIKITSSPMFDDVKSIVALHGDYSTAEPFVDWDFDYRIQKIGCHVRAYRRQVSQATQWKGNVGNAIIEEIDVEPRWLRWVNAAASCYGGLDILALDLVRNRVTAEEFILEVIPLACAKWELWQGSLAAHSLLRPQVNDTAIGLVRSNEDADHAAMRDIVLDRMNALWSKTAQHSPAGQTHATAGEAALDTDRTVASPDAAPVAVSMKSSASRDDQQALQLLQVNRKLEAQLQELKRRVAALEEEKARATEGETEKDKRCAQQ